MESEGEKETAAGPRVPEPTYDPDTVPGVATGEDVVAYYGKYGQDSTVKFFYCVRYEGSADAGAAYGLLQQLCTAAAALCMRFLIMQCVAKHGLVELLCVRTCQDKGVQLEQLHHQQRAITHGHAAQTTYATAVLQAS
jgi:hypothetical protein